MVKASLAAFLTSVTFFITNNSYAQTFNSIITETELHNSRLLDLESRPDNFKDLIVTDKFCGSGGCSTTIFKHMPDGSLKSVSEFLAYGVTVLQSVTNGYRDLLVSYRSDQNTLAYVQLKYNGSKYVAGRQLSERAAERAANAELQDLLNRAGYDAGTPDGAIGAKTRRAISAFQADNAFQATGKLEGGQFSQLARLAHQIPNLAATADDGFPTEARTETEEEAAQINAEREQRERLAAQTQQQSEPQQEQIKAPTAVTTQSNIEQPDNPNVISLFGNDYQFSTNPSLGKALNGKDWKEAIFEALSGSKSEVLTKEAADKRIADKLMQLEKELNAYVVTLHTIAKQKAPKGIADIFDGIIRFYLENNRADVFLSDWNLQDFGIQPVIDLAEKASRQSRVLSALRVNKTPISSPSLPSDTADSTLTLELPDVKKYKPSLAYDKIDECSGDFGIGVSTYTPRNKKNHSVLFSFSDICFDKISGTYSSAEKIEGFNLAQKSANTIVYERAISTNQTERLRFDLLNDKSSFLGYYNVSKNAALFRYGNNLKRKIHLPQYKKYFTYGIAGGPKYKKPIRPGRYEIIGSGGVKGDLSDSRSLYTKGLDLTEVGARAPTFYKGIFTVKSDGSLSIALNENKEVSNGTSSELLLNLVIDKGEISGNGSGIAYNPRLTGINENFWKISKFDNIEVRGHVIGEEGNEMYIILQGKGHYTRYGGKTLEADFNAILHAVRLD
ncbi:MAG: peptidoglycan-binding domain-containing protein [Lentilitoribacter sp.]